MLNFDNAIPVGLVSNQAELLSGIDVVTEDVIVFVHYEYAMSIGNLHIWKTIRNYDNESNKNNDIFAGHKLVVYERIFNFQISGSQTLLRGLRKG